MRCARHVSAAAQSHVRARFSSAVRAAFEAKGPWSGGGGERWRSCRSPAHLSRPVPSGVAAGADGRRGGARAAAGHVMRGGRVISPERPRGSHPEGVGGGPAPSSCRLPGLSRSQGPALGGGVAGTTRHPGPGRGTRLPSADRAPPRIAEERSGRRRP